MSRMVAAAACSLLISGTAAADGHGGKDDKIKRAMSAAPMMISGDAAIRDLDGSVLREGSNGWTCYPGVPLIPDSVDPMCNDAVWEAWIAAARAGEAFETDVIGFSYMLKGDVGHINNDNPAGTDKSKDNWIREAPHLMVLLPKSALGDIPTTPAMPGPYVMWGDTPMFHLMVPVADRKEGDLIAHKH